MNLEKIESFSNLSEIVQVLDEQNLVTSNFAVDVLYHLNKSHAFKAGIGQYKNGRTISIKVSSDELSSITYENAHAEYYYRYFGLSHVLELNPNSKLDFTIENGLSLNIRINEEEIFFFPTRKINYNYFFKLGVSDQIFKKIKVGGRFVFYKNLNNFFMAEIQKGFKPLSYGGEVFVQYTIEKRKPESLKTKLDDYH
jgi:hypothetical protein